MRNRIGDQADLAGFIEPSGSGPGFRRGTHHTLEVEAGTRAAADPPDPLGQAWQMTRYQAYQAQLAGRTIAETFARAAAFLKLAVAGTPALTDANVHAHAEHGGRGSTA